MERFTYCLKAFNLVTECKQVEGKTVQLTEETGTYTRDYLQTFSSAMSSHSAMPSRLSLLLVPDFLLSPLALPSHSCPARLVLAAFVVLRDEIYLIYERFI